MQTITPCLLTVNHSSRIPIPTEHDSDSVLAKRPLKLRNRFVNGSSSRSKQTVPWKRAADDSDAHRQMQISVSAAGVILVKRLLASVDGRLRHKSLRRFEFVAIRKPEKNSRCCVWSDRSVERTQPREMMAIRRFCFYGRRIAKRTHENERAVAGD